MINDKITPAFFPYGFKYPNEVDDAINETLKLCGVGGEDASMMYMEVLRRLGRFDELPPCERRTDE